MLAVWAILAPILVSDVLNPVLFGAVIFSLGSRRAFTNALSLVAGHTVTYMLSGVILAVGFEKLSRLLANPRPIDFVIEAIIGLVLLWLGYLSTRPADERADQGLDEGLTPFAAFRLGMVINLIGIPFAVPYFAALDQLLKADLEWTGVVTHLTIYNLLYAVPFLGILAIRLIFRKQSEYILQKINTFIQKAADVLMPIVLLGLGGALIADAAAFFIRGKSLF
jgi:threonine/homoserine/homoserine lactone efflux protein